jgi:hypothetical protein
MGSCGCYSQRKGRGAGGRGRRGYPHRAVKAIVLRKAVYKVSVAEPGDADIKTMSNATVQQGGDEGGRTKSASEPPPLARNKRRAPTYVLSPAKSVALIECFNNNGLLKQKGCWRGSCNGKPVSGVTVADLSRDGLLTVSTTRRRGSAQLTERGDWFAQTLIEA